MTVELICPYCRFSKQVPREKIPQGIKEVLCPRCGQRFDLSVPGDGPHPVTDKVAADWEFLGAGEGSQRGAGPAGSPWEERSEVGLLQGIYQTIRAVLFSPQRLFGTPAFTAGIREPLAFGLLVGATGRMFGLFWQFLMLCGGFFSFDLPISDQIPIGLVFPTLMVVIPIYVTVRMFLYSAVLQLLLLIVGGGKNGYEATFRVVAYSQATQALSLIPIVGGWIGEIWQLVVQIIGLREIHKTSYLRVVLAFLIPVALLFLLVIAVVIPLLIYLFGDATTY